MPIESGSYITDLNPLWPLGADFGSTLDNHARMTKLFLQQSLPTINGPLTATLASLNTVGVTQALSNSSTATATTAFTQGLIAGLTAPGSTSTTSVLVGSGLKSWTTQTGKAWLPGQPVVVSRTADPTNVQMYGVVSAYNSATGAFSATISSTGVVGSGTFTDWTMALTASAVAQVQSVNVVSGGVIDLSLGDYFYTSVNANQTFTFNNAPAAGKAKSFQLELYLTAGAITLPANAVWDEVGTPLPLAVSRRHLLFFTRFTDGSGWFASYHKGYPL